MANKYEGKVYKNTTTGELVEIVREINIAGRKETMYRGLELREAIHNGLGWYDSYEHFFAHHIEVKYTKSPLYKAINKC
jgi:hypothetical protein